MARKIIVGTEFYESNANRKVTVLSNIFEETEAVVGDVAIDVPSGSFVYTGLSPDIIVDIDILINIPTGVYQYAGLIPRVALPVDFTPSINLPKRYSPSYRQATGIQPTGPLEIDWSNPLTKNMVGVWLTNGFNRELVQNRPLPITGSDFTLKRDNKGTRVDFGNTQTTWFEVSLAESQSYLIGTKDFSWAGLVDIQAAPGEQTLFQIGRGQTGGRRFSIFLNTTEVWDGEIDDDVFRSDFNFISAPPLNERSILVITADRDVAVVGYINGQIDGTADISGSQGSLDDAEHGVHIGYNQELNVGSRDNISRSGFELNVLWHRLLSDVEVQSFSRDPYQILKPATRSISFQAPPDVDVEIPTGGYRYSGLIPNLITTIRIDTPTGGYRYNGLSPILDITNDISINVPVGAYNYLGLSPTLQENIPVATGSYQYSGLVPSVLLTNNITIPSGSFVYSGFIPDININITVPFGTYQYTGFTPILITGDDVAIDIPTGVYGYSGLIPAISVTADFVLNVPTGSYQYTGIAPNIDLPVLVDIPNGVINYNGLNPTLIFENRLSIPTGNYNYTGLIPEINIIAPDRTIDVPVGVFAYTGFSPVVVQDPIIVEVPIGSYAYLGLVPIVSTGEIAVTPTVRTFSVISENRVFAISAANRTLEV